MTLLDTVSSPLIIAPCTNGSDDRTLRRSRSIVSAFRWISRYSLFLIMFVCTTFASDKQTARTLQSFGVGVRHGHPVYPLPSNVALGLFNPDPLLDLAYYADGKVQVWQNLANGTFGTEPVYEQHISGVITKMELRKSNMFNEMIFDHTSWGDLYLTLADGREEKISHEEMLAAKRSFASLPQTTASFPPLNFREVWRSPSNRVTSYHVWVDDIDNDGRTEAIYYLYEGPPAADGRLMVYENISNNLYRLDWDTLMVRGGYPIAITDIDNDGHKEIVVGYNDGAGCGLGLLECIGPGRYRFFRSNLCLARTVRKVLETDFDHDGIKELSVLTSDSSPSYDRTFVYLAEFTGKFDGFMSFSGQLVRFDSYVVEFAVAQVDGQGWDEVILGSGGFLSGGAEDITYLKYRPPDGPFAWRPHYFSVGLPVLCTTPMAINLDADSTKEIVIGGVGPLGHGSMYVINNVTDSTWTPMWVDSSFRSSPLWVNSGRLYESQVIAGANDWYDGVTGPWSQWKTYDYTGGVLGFWRTDSSITIHLFHLLDIDRDLLPNLVFAQLSLRDGDRLVDYEIQPTLGVETHATHPDQTTLRQNFPNPFNSNTKIEFELKEKRFVELTVYDVLGAKVKQLAFATVNAGTHSFSWDGGNEAGVAMASGIYFYSLKTDGVSLKRKLILLR